VNIHEYQAKEFFRNAGLDVPEGKACFSVEEATATAEQYGMPVMVKAQVLTGGRGKAGGVKFCDSMDKVKESAEAILGMDIKSHTVNKVLVTPAVDIEEEYYVGMLVDRASRRVLLMASSEGGVEIEQVAKDNPDAIIKQVIDPRYGLLDHEAMTVSMKLTADVKKARQLAASMQKLYTAFIEVDASLAEINPFIFTPDGIGKAIDAKVNIDDNAMFRHSDFEALRDLE
jgi:succinyl-CoA synthetase beta subunit